MIAFILVAALILAPVAIWPRYWIAVAVALLFHANGATLILHEPENTATILRQQLVALPVTMAVLSGIVFLRKRFPVRRP